MANNPFQPIVGVAGKKYGLIVKAKPAPPSVFSAEDDDQAQPVNATYIQQVNKSKSEKKAQEAVSQALAEDPTIFDYDGVVDAIQEKRTETSNQRQLQAQKREPKYIKALLDRAEIRKKEDRVVFDRKLKKEREVDDAEHGDKEKFVTQSYLDQLEADRLWREEEAKKAADEEKNDVTKRGMSNFYRNLFSADNVATGGGPRNFNKQKTEQPAATAPSPPATAAASGSSPVKDEPRSPPLKRERSSDEQTHDPKRARDADNRSASPPAPQKQKTEQPAAATPSSPPVAAAAATSVPVVPAVPKPAAAPVVAPPKLDDAAVLAARERYLARKKQQGS